MPCSAGIILWQAVDPFSWLIFGRKICSVWTRKPDCFPLYLSCVWTPDFSRIFVYTGHRPENIDGTGCPGHGNRPLLMQRHTDYVRCPDVVTVDIAPQVESSICLVRLKDVHPNALGQSFGILCRMRLCRSPDNMVFRRESIPAKRNCTAKRP